MKRVGTKIYVHRNYAHEVIPIFDLLEAKIILEKKFNYPLEKWEYVGIRYDTKDRSVAFQWCPGFDRQSEPCLTSTLVVKKDGKIRFGTSPVDPMIWHHKWMWVGPDYKGFNIEESKARSVLWRPLATPYDLRRIGRWSYWKGFCQAHGIPL